MEVDQHFGGIGQMIRLGQCGHILLSDLQYLVLQRQIERGGDDQAGPRQVGEPDVQGCCQLAQRVADKVRSKGIIDDTRVQELWTLCLGESQPFLYGRNIALQAQLIENGFRA